MSEIVGVADGLGGVASCAAAGWATALGGFAAGGAAQPARASSSAAMFFNRRADSVIAPRKNATLRELFTQTKLA
jgi:hypothetical protein